MKKTLTILLTVFVLIAAIGIFAMTSFALTQDNDGWYEIGSAQDLLDFRATATNGANAKLTADIDMTGKEWTPFSSIIIQFDGQGHTIKNITVNKTKGTEVWTGVAYGLFADELTNGPASTVQNVIFENCTLNATLNGGDARVGLVAGFANRAAAYGITLKNCHINISGTADSIHCGSIIGASKWAHSVKFADGSEATMAGGVVDAASSITFADTASISGAKYVGGIIGSCDYTGLIIQASKFNGTITAPEDSRVGAFAGDVWNKVGLYDCALEGNSYATLCFYAANGFEYGASTPEGYNYLIDRINTSNANQSFYLYGDIDFTGKEFKTITVDYKGTIDGQNHTISNISVTHNNVDGGNYGIIANKLANNPNGTVQNLTLKNASMTLNMVGTNSTNVGAITGLTDRGNVVNVTLQNVDILVTSADTTLQANVALGGAIGQASFATAAIGGVGCKNVTTDKDCSVICTTQGFTDVGGIIGKVGASYTDPNTGITEPVVIDGCTNQATVKSNHIAGGILGYYSCGSENNVISNCKNYGNVYSTSTGSGAAAIVVTGTTTMKVTNCTAGGFITGPKATIVSHYEVTKTNVKEVAILNPLVDQNGDEKDLFGYFQTTEVDANGKLNLRIIFLAKRSYVEAVDTLNIKMSFTLKDAAVKTKDATLGNVVYKQITADGDVFTAPDDIVMFGYIIKDIPVAEADAFTVTVTDGQETSVFTGNGKIN